MEEKNPWKRPYNVANIQRSVSSFQRTLFVAIFAPILELSFRLKIQFERISNF